MSKGDYVVYERASRNEDSFFLEAAKEATSVINERETGRSPEIRTNMQEERR